MSELWRPFDPGFIKNPYPAYQRIQATDPIFRTQHGEWVFLRYSDIQDIIKDPRFKAGNRAEWLKQISNQHQPPLFNNLLEAIGAFLVFKNGFDHTDLRKFITHSWRDRSVTELIQKNIAFLSTRVDWDYFDFASEIAEPLPALTMAGILGIPEAEYPFLIRHSRTMIKSLDAYLALRDIRAMEESTKELSEFFLSALKRKKNYPDNSLMSKMLESTQQYSLQEIAYSCIFLFISGEETTASLLSLGIMHLLNQNKWSDLTVEQINELLADELIRFDPPTQIIARHSSEHVSQFGIELEPNSKITLCLAAANRDPSVFERPNELVLNRKPKHLSFGYGFHHCLGDWLAKAEAVELWRYLRRRFSQIEIKKELALRHNLTIRSVENLFISCRE